MPTRIAMAAARAFLICLLALAVLGFRAPLAEQTRVAEAGVSTHDHHGHSHDDEDEPSTQTGHGHDRFHVGDHSHDTPSAAVLIGFGFFSPRGPGPGTLDARAASWPTPPGDRPPRQT